jgi:hypothetical protein
MKIKVQTLYLQPGDIVGSGETVSKVIANAGSLPSNKCYVYLMKNDQLRIAEWGKYTMINVERENPAYTKSDEEWARSSGVIKETNGEG